mgnify:FL=1
MNTEFFILSIALASALLYAVASWREFRFFVAPTADGIGQPIAPTNIQRLPLLGLSAAVLHVLFTVLDTAQYSFSTSFVDALSFTSLVVVSTTFVTRFRYPVGSLFIPVFAIAAVCLLLAATMPGHTAIHAPSAGLLVHIFCSMIGYSLLSMAAIQAIVLLLLDRSLKQHRGTVFGHLPPLQTMESLLFQFVALGWLTLTLAIGSGMIFIENMFEQHLAHKTVFSLISWLLFGVLLWGRRTRGWRGMVAIRWTLIAFVALALAYFGSKFVLGVVLHRL